MAPARLSCATHLQALADRAVSYMEAYKDLIASKTVREKHVEHKGETKFRQVFFETIVPFSPAQIRLRLRLCLSRTKQIVVGKVLRTMSEMPLLIDHRQACPDKVEGQRSERSLEGAKTTEKRRKR